MHTFEYTQPWCFWNTDAGADASKAAAEGTVLAVLVVLVVLAVVVVLVVLTPTRANDRPTPCGNAALNSPQLLSNPILSNPIAVGRPASISVPSLASSTPGGVDTRYLLTAANAPS
jgi:hypothetical protein